ncbi:1,4-beta-D-glucan glucohydrolase [Altererythrobacter salegens]|uniref:1,4-beta-D-glucan glucohydrolase n=1 Tax=Croceibacterium salegens TaxID=1737568 RepID=A0A6I4SVD3_9SPHN|nr:glycoside hydrolase family 3 protein [Croceibacterium salegens]MXO59478.1 1,4-beta-D-glucan glucohydrolase [Croceibacterium salegens]
MRIRRFGVTLLGTIALAACSAASDRGEDLMSGSAHPDKWPEAASPAAFTDPATEAAIDDLLAKMTLEQKVGQLVQADISFITPADLEKYPLGSILAGGNGGPNGNERASAADWARMVAQFREISLRPAANGVAIPIIFGIDAVHGHSNIPGATLFPHNIGLGAAHDPELLRRIGAVTAAEVAGSGIDWTFAPTLAVPQDLRWGRSYEGYSSDPAIVAEYSTAMVDGIQGRLEAGRPLAADKVAATAKHFLADGGTRGGQDQGDAQISEEDLVAIHDAGYPPAIDAGVLTVMASFSSWNGAKNHGNKSLLTDVLKDRMGFKGFVVGDWNAHGQVPGCTPTDCPQALMAGLDLYMAPDSWKALFENLVAEAKAGKIPQERIDDAVRRILRVKFKLGLMGPAKVDRTDPSVVGAPEHLALAREAVAKSLVLLKNEGSVLPVKAGAKVLVAGPGADNMAMQAGGWTISWQGVDVTKADFPNGQTVGEGIVDAVKEAGGTARLSADGFFGEKPDVAIVIYGETPYAEFQGDVAYLDYQPGNATDLALIKKLKAQGIPVVSVFLSGRPLFVGPEMAASDAFVAAWLPGSQGAGVADVLVAGKDGKTARQFAGTLSFDWPAGCEPGAKALFSRGFGGTYATAPKVPELATKCALENANKGDTISLYSRGLKAGVTAGAEGTAMPNFVGKANGLAVTAFDVAAQEDSRRLTWSAPATLALTWKAQELPASEAVEFRYRVATAPTKKVTLAAPSGSPIDLTQTFAIAAGKEWRTLQIPLTCLAKGQLGEVQVRSEGSFVLELQSVTLVSKPLNTSCTGPF